MVFTSFQDCHPASALSFSTVRLQVVFGPPLLLFPSGTVSSYLHNVTIDFCTVYVFMMFLRCIRGLFSSVASCWLWLSRII